MFTYKSTTVNVVCCVIKPGTCPVYAKRKQDSVCMICTVEVVKEIYTHLYITMFLLAWSSCFFNMMPSVHANCLSVQSFNFFVRLTFKLNKLL